MKIFVRPLDLPGAGRAVKAGCAGEIRVGEPSAGPILPALPGPLCRVRGSWLGTHRAGASFLSKNSANTWQIEQK